MARAGAHARVCASLLAVLLAYAAVVAAEPTARVDSVVTTTNTAEVSAAGSTAGNTGVLTYQWESVPAGAATFSSAIVAEPIVTLTNGPGAYTVRVTVTETGVGVTQDTADATVYYAAVEITTAVASRSFVEPLASGATVQAYNSVEFSAQGFPADYVGAVHLWDAVDHKPIGRVRSLTTLSGKVALDYSQVSGERNAVFITVDFIITAPDIVSVRATSANFALSRRHAYEAGTYGACQIFDGSCGMGERVRPLVCKDMLTNTQAAEFNCRLAAVPQTVQLCNVPCDTDWFYYEDWGQCDRECGGGIQTRTVSCYDSLGNNATTDCSARSTRPRRQQSCNTNDCPTFDWAYSAWSSCSVSCGGGVQSRSVLCVDHRGESVPDFKCDLTLLESTAQACNADACPATYWELGTWGACSESCGGGTSTRTVTCMSGGSTATEATCTNNGLTKPDTSRTCNTAPCTVRRGSRVYGGVTCKCPPRSAAKCHASPHPLRHA